MSNILEKIEKHPNPSSFYYHLGVLQTGYIGFLELLLA